MSRAGSEHEDIGRMSPINENQKKVQIDIQSMEEEDNVSYDLSDLEGDVIDGSGNAATVPVGRSHKVDLLDGNYLGSEGSMNQNSRNLEDLGGSMDHPYDQQSLDLVKYNKSKSSMDEVKRYNVKNKSKDIKASMQQFNDYQKKPRWIAMFFPQPEMPYINESPIDQYIDNYWIMHCPSSYGQRRIDLKVRELVHRILISEKMPPKDELELNQATLMATQSLDGNASEHYSKKYTHQKTKKKQNTKLDLDFGSADAKRSYLNSLSPRPKEVNTVKKLGVGAFMHGKETENVEQQFDITQRTRFGEKKKEEDIEQNQPKKMKESEVIKENQTLVDTHSILRHQKEIDAIMIAIKPNISHYLCKSYSKEMIKKYFRKVREEEKVRVRVEFEISNMMKLKQKDLILLGLENKKGGFLSKYFNKPTVNPGDQVNQGGRPLPNAMKSTFN